MNYLIAFYFIANTLFWVAIPSQSATEVKLDNCYFIRFQENRNMPPDINQEDIDSIKVYDDIVKVFAGNKSWVLHYTGDPEMCDWWVEPVVIGKNFKPSQPLY